MEASDINQKAIGRKTDLKQTLKITKGMENFREYTIIKSAKIWYIFAKHFFLTLINDNNYDFVIRNVS